MQFKTSQNKGKLAYNSAKYVLNAWLSLCGPNWIFCDRNKVEFPLLFLSANIVNIIHVIHRPILYFLSTPYFPECPKVFLFIISKSVFLVKSDFKTFADFVVAKFHEFFKSTNWHWIIYEWVWTYQNVSV